MIPSAVSNVLVGNGYLPEALSCKVVVLFGSLAKQTSVSRRLQVGEVDEMDDCGLFTVGNILYTKTGSEVLTRE